MNRNTPWYLLLAGLVPASFCVLQYLTCCYHLAFSPVLLFFASMVPSLVLLISDSTKPSADEQQRKSIQNGKAVPKEMLRAAPAQNKDIILGRKDSRYVCTSTEQDGHWMIIGGTGSGKTSSVLLPLLLNNPDTAAIVVDVKDHELYRKSCRADDDRAEVFDPEKYDGTTCGFNPFYQLDSGSSEYDIMDSIQIVTNSIVPIPADVRDPFWKQNARNLLMGLSLYYYEAEACHTLIEIVDRILSLPVEEQIKTVLDNTAAGSIARKYLVMFSSMENETLYGIFAELASSLTIFNHPGIRYAFGPGCRQYISPLDVEQNKRIFLCIDMSMLATMNTILHLILDVMIYGLETRTRGKDEQALNPVLFIIDELPTVISGGGLSQLLVGIRVLRSAKVHFWMALQNLPSLIGAYSRDEVSDIVSNMNLIVLSSNNPETTHMLTDLVGTFKAKDKSFSGKGHKKTTISFKDEDVIKASDISTLPEEEKALVITSTGWMIIRKCPYFKDKYLSVLAAEIARYNRTVQELIRPVQTAAEESDMATPASDHIEDLQRQIAALLNKTAQQRERK